MMTGQNPTATSPAALNDDKALGRFEWHEAGETSYVTYHYQGGVMVLDHSFVPESLAGQGVGSRMVKAVLDKLLRSNQKIVVRCDFINHMILRNNAYRPLIQP